MGPTRHAAHGQERPGEPAPGPPHSSGDKRPLPGRGASAPSPHALRIVWWCGPTTAGVRSLGLGLLRPRRPTRAWTLTLHRPTAPWGWWALQSVCVTCSAPPGSADEGAARGGTAASGRWAPAGPARQSVGSRRCGRPSRGRTETNCPPCLATEVRRGRPRPPAVALMTQTPQTSCAGPRGPAPPAGSRGASPLCAPPRPGAEEAQAPRPCGQPALRGPRSPHR